MYKRFTRSLLAAFVVVTGLFSVAALTPAAAHSGLTATPAADVYYHYGWWPQHHWVHPHAYYYGNCGYWGCPNYGYTYPYYSYQPPVLEFNFGHHGWHHWHH